MRGVPGSKPGVSIPVFEKGKKMGGPHGENRARSQDQGQSGSHNVSIHIPYGLAVRITGFHPVGRGSTPRGGISFGKNLDFSVRLFYYVF